MAKSPFGLLGTIKEANAKPEKKGAINVAHLHAKGCDACPLVKAAVHSPKMAPTGASNPLLYVLGEAPGRTEDETPDEHLPKYGGRRVRQFLGKAGQRLREQIPEELEAEIRWNNAINDRPPGNRTPTPTEIECCRPRVASDIASSKPKAILALGPVALNWFGCSGGIKAWRGRRFPYRVGEHRAWVYPTFHPSAIVRIEAMRAKDRRSVGQLDAEQPKLFERDLKRLWKDLGLLAGAKNLADLHDQENYPLPEPETLAEEDFLKDYRAFTGGGNEARAELRKALERVDLKRVSVDVETHKLRPYWKDSKLLSIALSDGKRTVAVGLEHPRANWDSVAAVWNDVLVPFILSAKRLVAHKSIFDSEWIADRVARYTKRRAEEILFAPWDDTQSQAYVLDGNKGMLSLDTRMLLEFGVRVKALSNVDRGNLINMDLNLVLRYNAIDAESLPGLFRKQRAELKRRGQQEAYLLHIQRFGSLGAAQRKGMKVDLEEAKRQQSALDVRVKELQGEFYRDPDVVKYTKKYGALNTSSTKQLVVLYKEMLGRLEGARDGGKYSTDEDALTEMAANGVSSAAKLLDIRGLVKLKGTYLDSLLSTGKDAIVYPDGRLHTNFSDTGTDTTRVASDDPNMLNFPSREHKEVRNVVTAGKNRLLLAGDQGQIEYRVIANLSGDSVICKAIEEGYDIHLEWAQRLAKAFPRLLADWGGDMEKLRSAIKTQFVFPAFYRAGERSIAASLEVPQDELSVEFKTFWRQFEGVRAWQDRLIAFYRENGYTESPTLRKRFGPLSDSAIVNTPVQCAAAEIVMASMVKIARVAFERNDPDLYPVLNIYDDLTFDVAKSNLENVVETILPLMVRTDFEWMKVPLSVELKVGKRWGDMKKLGTYTAKDVVA